MRMGSEVAGRKQMEVVTWIWGLYEQNLPLVPWDRSPVLRHVEGGLISMLSLTVNGPPIVLVGTGRGPLVIPVDTLTEPQTMLTGTTNRPLDMLVGT